MKKLIYTFLFFIALMPMAFGMAIEGGVTYNVDEAREYVNEGLPQNVDILGAYVFQDDSTVERTVYSYNNDNKVIGITVLYKKEPDKTYIYNSNKRLIYVEKYDKPVTLYPHRGYRYDLNHNLVLTSLTVSKNEMFRFEPDGKLIVHSINGIIYDENGKIIGHGK